jgi:hypothetical protein
MLQQTYHAADGVAVYVAAVGILDAKAIEKEPLHEKAVAHCVYVQVVGYASYFGVYGKEKLAYQLDNYTRDIFVEYDLGNGSLQDVAHLKSWWKLSVQTQGVLRQVQKFR